MIAKHYDDQPHCTYQSVTIKQKMKWLMKSSKLLHDYLIMLLQQALKTWSNFNLVLFGKGREIHITTLAKSMIWWSSYDIRMMSTVPDDVLSCFLSFQIVLKIVRNKDIYDSFFWKFWQCLCIWQGFTFPSLKFNWCWWCCLAQKSKSTKAQQSKSNLLKILIPKAAEKIPGKNFLIYISRIVEQGYSQAGTFWGVLNVSLRAYLGTFHKQILDIYSEGNSFIRK